MPDAFGRAIRDWHRDEQDEPLVQRDGEQILEHPVESFYFGEFAAESDYGAWLASVLDGPLLDLGAGAGRDALYFQDCFETVAIEVSDHLVETMEDRGVEDARRGSMFELREQFEAGRFQSALAIGTQMCLAGSMQGLRSFLADLSHVTTPDATAVLHSYDPGADGIEDLLGFRDDPTPGLAHRVQWFEYEDEVDEALYFRLFSPDKLREAADATGWKVREVRRPFDPFSYRAALEKR